MPPTQHLVNGSSTLLVCTTDEDGTPHAVLADGAYVSDGERVFWRGCRDSEVLRVPLDREPTIRQLRRFATASSGRQAAQRLVAAAHPSGPSRAQEADDDHAQLLLALQAGDHTATEVALSRVWRRTGLRAAHIDLARALDEVCRAGRAGTLTPTAELLAIATARTVLEVLCSSSRPAAGADPVLLTTPPEDRHTLALTALAHQLHEAGRSTLAVDDLPTEEQLALVRTGRVPAVVVSAHLPQSQAAVRRTVAAIRSANPTTKVVMGGPGIPAGVRGPDLVTDSASELLDLLGGAGGVLTVREREVLTATADGLTNNQIGDALGLSPATVKTHLDNVFAKTGTVHRAAAVAFALRKGWIT